MADPRVVNGGITDAMTQVNVEVVSASPAVAMANLFQATSQALANAAHNSALAQQQMHMTAQAATTMGIALLYSLGKPQNVVAAKKNSGE
jgi:Killing trait